MLEKIASYNLQPGEFNTALQNQSLINQYPVGSKMAIEDQDLYLTEIFCWIMRNPTNSLGYAQYGLDLYTALQNTQIESFDEMCIQYTDSEDSIFEQYPPIALEKIDFTKFTDAQLSQKSEALSWAEKSASDYDLIFEKINALMVEVLRWINDQPDNGFAYAQYAVSVCEIFHRSYTVLFMDEFKRF